MDNLRERFLEETHQISAKRRSTFLIGIVDGNERIMTPGDQEAYERHISDTQVKNEELLRKAYNSLERLNELRTYQNQFMNKLSNYQRKTFMMN